MNKNFTILASLLVFTCIGAAANAADFFCKDIYLQRIEILEGHKIPTLIAAGSVFATSGAIAAIAASPPAGALAAASFLTGSIYESVLVAKIGNDHDALAIIEEALDGRDAALNKMQKADEEYNRRYA